jgi:hypothetical protein
MTRSQALALIRAEVAQAGRVTSLAMAYYAENRVSYPAFEDAVRLGLLDHRRRSTPPPPPEPEDDPRCAACGHGLELHDVLGGCGYHDSEGPCLCGGFVHAHG